MGFSEVSIKRNPATELGAIAFLFASGSIRECGRRAPEEDMTPPERLSELGRLRQKRPKSVKRHTPSMSQTNAPHKRIRNSVLVRYSLSPRLQISRRSKRFRAGKPFFGNSLFSLASEEPGHLTV